MHPWAEFARTARGRRELNQDRAEVLETFLGDRSAHILAVADGMGGLAFGETAAEIAMQTVRRYAVEVFPRTDGSDESVRRALQQLYEDANGAILEFVSGSGSETGAGTTLVCCIVDGARFLVTNVGDSRAYHIVAGGTRQITRDHNQAQAERDAIGALPSLNTPDSLSHVLIRSLGEPGTVAVDFFPSDRGWSVIDEPCVLLLCSDGVHGVMQDRDFGDQCSGTRSLQAACSNLLSLAFARGSSDNVGIAACEWGVLARQTEQQLLLPDVELLMSQANVPVRQPRRSGRRRKLPVVPLVLSGIFVVALVAFLLLWMSMMGGTGAPGGFTWASAPAGAGQSTATVPAAGAAVQPAPVTQAAPVAASPSAAPAAEAMVAESHPQPEAAPATPAPAQEPARAPAPVKEPAQSAVSPRVPAPVSTPAPVPAAAPAKAPVQAPAPIALTPAPFQPTVPPPAPQVPAPPQPAALPPAPVQQAPAPRPVPAPAQPASQAASSGRAATLNIEIPPNLELEADKPGGKVVEFRDLVSASYGAKKLNVVCTPRSGSTFKMGATTVGCVAAGPDGTTRQEEFTIKVVDHTPPEIGDVLFVPIETKRSRTEGSMRVEVTAKDTVDPSPVCAIEKITDLKPRRGKSPDLASAKKSDLAFDLPRDAEATVTVACRDASGNRGYKNVQFSGKPPK